MSLPNGNPNGGRLETIPPHRRYVLDNGETVDMLLTANGAPYRYLLKLNEQVEIDANQSLAWIETFFDEVYKLKTDFFGSSSYGNAERLHRVPPLPHGYYPTQRLKRMDLEGFQGELPTGVYIKADAITGYPRIEGLAQYRLTFMNPPWNVLSDSEIVSGNSACPPELQRYCRFTRNYISESRKVPSAGFSVIYDATVPNAGSAFQPFVIQEVGAVPGYELEYTVESVQWPIENVPELSISKAIGTVNDGNFRLGVRVESGALVGGATYTPGQLLFKGLAQPITPYVWIDGKYYVDIVYLFGFRPPLGWNFHRLNDGRWHPLVVKGTEPAPVGDGTKKPMFLSSDFAKLFKPEQGW